MQMHLIVPTLVLVGAVVTDLRARSVFNTYLLVSAAAVLINNFAFFGLSSIQTGLLGFGMAVVMTMPLFIARILGGGDVKLLFVLGLGTSYPTIMNVTLWSFMWGALVGLIYAIISGSGKKLVLNTVNIVRGRKPAPTEIHRLPFAVAVLLAWMTHIALLQRGGVLW